MSVVSEVRQQTNNHAAELPVGNRKVAESAWSMAVDRFRAKYPNTERQTALAYAEERYWGLCAMVYRDKQCSFDRHTEELTDAAYMLLLKEHAAFNKYAR